VTFTDPEVGHVGLSEAQARERWGASAVTAEADYADLDRAITAGQASGFALLIGDPKGRLVGATVAAPAGGEAIAELTAWLRQKAKIDAVSTTVHAYPTFAEGPSRAADEHIRRKLLNPRVRRLARPALALARLLLR
jgi:pyruvate/2-oxoglutarate dehydrogenase complex dihydrolipoamide dehydrogenase (E3) component